MSSLFSFLNKTQAQQGLVGLSFDSEGFSLSHLLPGKPQSTVQLCKYHTSDASNVKNTLIAAVKQHGLTKGRCVLVLEPGTYSLLQVELPAVPREELIPAIRWKIKDLIDFHIDDSVIDLFDIPVDEQRGRAPMAYVVAARASLIQERVDMILASGLELTAIDIPELALRNLLTHYDEDVSGVALVHLSKQAGQIVLTRQSHLYLARSFSLGLDYLLDNPSADGQQAFVDSLALELQRSMDYYESYFGQPPISTILVTPDMTALNALYANIEENLRIKTHGLDLKHHVSCSKNIDASQLGQCLLAICGALRVELPAT